MPSTTCRRVTFIYFSVHLQEHRIAYYRVERSLSLVNAREPAIVLTQTKLGGGALDYVLLTVGASRCQVENGHVQLHRHDFRFFLLAQILTRPRADNFLCDPSQ